ncbi:UNVERIFIED_CONTAM: hypothetical protein HDU68_010468 [Siphonaria sp. JEL0065]|nr:hypothetical protein HDU68_010468 [Siphonaria sp. JEL0065]
MRPIPCIRCRQSRRKCSLQTPSCERCLRLGVGTECTYPWTAVIPAVSTSSSPTETPQRSSPKQPQGPTPLDQYMKALESNMVDQESGDWAVEDPDLMPTTQDWFLLHRFFTLDERAVQVILSTDANHILDTFFQQPAHLRLTLCAIAAHYASPAVPESVALNYYKRARKAVFRVLDKPSVKVVHTFYWINSFATWKGQPAIGQPFLAAALDMIILLRLDIDPDDSPWLYHLNLTEAEKEDRRRAFWSCFYFLKVQQSLSSEALQIPIRSDQLKPPRPVTEPYPAYVSFDSFSPVCSMYNLLSEIRKHHSTIPSTLTEILSSEPLTKLTNNLIATHSKIPIEYMLITESPEVLTESDNSRFLAQFAFLPLYEFRFVLCMNLNAMASISLLHRPRMYLAGLTKPSRLDVKTRNIISTSINQSLEAAHRIGCFLEFLIAVTANANGEKKEHYEWNILVMHPLFEAMLVFWFIMCRMDPEWWPLIKLRTVSWEIRREKAGVLAQCVKTVSMAQMGMMDPLSLCMEAMWKEMDEVKRNGRRNALTGDEVDDIIIGMHVVSLGDATAGEVENESVTAEPWAFLGLLGLEVSGGFRWHASYEVGWRQFWKSLQL